MSKPKMMASWAKLLWAIPSTCPVPLHRSHLALQLPDGSKDVPVGKIIAMLAEEGDDISNIEVPAEDAPAKEEASSSSSSAPPTSQSSSQSSEKAASAPSHGPINITHSRPLFPSVARLLQEHGISNANKIKGTGIRGMLTKGDVLTHLGLASSPWGTAKQAEPVSAPSPTPKVEKVEKVRILAILLSAIPTFDRLRYSMPPLFDH